MYNYSQLNLAARDIADNNIAHGFKEPGEQRDPVHVSMLITSEPIEAFEELRSGHEVDEVYFECPGDNKSDKHTLQTPDDDLDFIGESGMAICKVHGIPIKPEGWPIEMIDCMIRILDACAEYGLDAARLLQVKMAYNVTREHKHGRTM